MNLMQPISDFGYHHPILRPDPETPTYKRILIPNCTHISCLWLSSSLACFFRTLFFTLFFFVAMASKSSKPATKKKSSKGFASSSSTELILRKTIQLFSLVPLDYNESVRIMIQFISIHPIAIPLKKIPNPNFPLRLLHRAFVRIKIEDGILEVKITTDRIVLLHKSTFLRAIGVAEDPQGFLVQEPTP